MKSTLIVECGLIGTDGHLWLPQDRLMQFYREHNGERAIVKIEALERHSSSATLRYYFGYVIPTARQALVRKGILKTANETHQLFWDMYPGEHDRAQDIREAPASQVSMFIDWLKMLAAEWLEVYIEDSKII